MKTTDSGLILPDAPQKIERTIDDFDLMNPVEMQTMLVQPIEQALQQGISPDQPTTIPIGGLCSLIKTIREMSATLAQVKGMGDSMINDETVPVEYQDQMRSILGIPKEIDVSSLFGQVSDKENNDV